MGVEKKELSGRVIKEVVGKGSKSERAAVILDTGKERYVLRRQGGNAFSDPTIDKLVGKKISAVGNVTGYTFLMKEWSEDKDEK